MLGIKKRVRKCVVMACLQKQGWETLTYTKTNMTVLLLLIILDGVWPSLQNNKRCVVVVVLFLYKLKRSD